MRVWDGFLSGLLLLSALDAGFAQSFTDRYVVDAEVRALGRQDYEIGTTTLTFTPEAAAGFRIAGKGRVSHPLDAAAVYEYDFDMRFRLKGDKLEIVSRRNTSNEAGKEILDKVENIFPFAYLSRVMPPREKGYRLDTRNGVYTMKFDGSGRDVEVAVANQGGEVARFFVRTGSRGVAALPKFRIIRRNGANLMFHAN